jgi:radical SAM superfamily enzyme YgiQ (UPF0313 family)
MKVLLVIPPFTQSNTPYPATMQLAGFLNSKGYEAESFDLSLEVTLKIFSCEGLRRIFDSLDNNNVSETKSKKILRLRNKYEEVIDFIILFLQSGDEQLAKKIVAKDFLPRGESFENLSNREKAVGYINTTDKAKHLCSLVIDDLTKFIKSNITPHFGLSRYAESIAISPATFDPILSELKREPNIIEKIILEETKKMIQRINPEIIGFTIPFPGNLLGALISAKVIKENFPKIKIVFGGGYVNTELRSLQDTCLFEYCDYITYDDGEIPLLKILENVEYRTQTVELVRTLVMEDGKLDYKNGTSTKNILHDELTAPSLKGIEPGKYISMIEMLNPMHRLWSDGYWNKLTLAHGCYWRKCTFCDITLDYIGRYSSGNASRIVDWIETMIKQSGSKSFHFTDEAAPPSLLKELSMEILKRKLKIKWWGNIRFEKAFTYDLCKLMSSAGCIAVSGGIEVADDRLLMMIYKGVTIEQAAIACSNFRKAGIMVHAYLMYGFPTQTEQETVNSLEMVRQFMHHGLIQSAFWHLFTLTVHSPIARDPEKFLIEINSRVDNPFANNNLEHADKSQMDHKRFSTGLNKALYNYMHGIGLDWDVREWFEFPVVKSSVEKNLIVDILRGEIHNNPLDRSRAVWIGEKPELIKTENGLIEFIVRNGEIEGIWELDFPTATWLNQKIIDTINSISKEPIKYFNWKEFYAGDAEFNNFLRTDVWSELREHFLLFV